jgi:purine-cytosine permease-like protein
MFFVWFTSNFNILAFSTGSAAPAFFGMDIKHAVAIFIVVDTM